jgi:hypothetical protein
MKFYTITAVSNYLERPLIESFHAHMFHGRAERGGKEYPHDATVWAHSESPTPLLISRTIRHVPDVSQPSTHLVVSERLAAKLRRIQNIRLAPTVFKRLVDVDWQKGDMSYDEIWNHPDPPKLLRTLPDVAEFHQQIGSFFEVQTYRLRDVLERYPAAKEVTVEQRTPPMHEIEVIRVSSEMLTDYPMLWCGATIMNPDVFDILDAALDRDFFIVRKYEVD